MNCPECGAPGVQCEPRYYDCLAKEFEDAGVGAVHHLTVSTYMLQHSSKLSRQGWLETRRLLRDFLINNKPPSQIRRQNKNNVDSGKRKWKITSKDDISKISRSSWTKTILDVRLEDAEAYRSDVRAWAQSALMDSEKEA